MNLWPWGFSQRSSESHHPGVRAANEPKLFPAWRAHAAHLENVQDELELREQKLPSQATWDKVRERAAAVFGVTASPLLNASNVSKLIGDIQAEIAARKDGLRATPVRLKQVAPQLADAGTRRPGSRRLRW